MQTTLQKQSIGQKIGWFTVGPMTVLVVVALIALLTLGGYESRHDNRIYTGVAVGAVDLSEQTPATAADRLREQYTAVNQPILTLTDPGTGREWQFSPADFGVTLDADTTAENAFAVGRNGAETVNDVFDSWYYGTQVAPVLVLDEAQLLTRIDTIAAEINQAASNASVRIEGESVTFENSQVGRTLDKAHLHEMLLGPLTAVQPAEIELLVHASKPRVYDASAAAADIANILSGPMSFYLQKPIDGLDLDRITVSEENLREWLRVRLIDGADGQAEYDIFIDEVALRGWLEAYADKISRAAENARFYFDDPTQELVLVEPHVNGRELDIEATITQFNEQITTPNRSVPLVINEIQPVAHSGVTAAELGITELVGESTTWFYGSSNNRKHNIARSAANFYGIVVAPGETFSFNKYLGDVSIEEGYETGLIIYGGRTIEGVGGGVCQVSTTLFQSVFWAGLDVGQRLEHAYRVGYYEDGAGPGMDATVFSPIVDFTFTNNTENHLLIENYYNEIYESLTFKIYSTDIGRTVEKIGPTFENVQEPPPDEWIYNNELAAGEIKQVEFAADGARVTVGRVVTNFAGELRDQDTFVSNYIPWGNVYEYGPQVNPNNISGEVYDLLWVDGEVNLFDLENEERFPDS